MSENDAFKLEPMRYVLLLANDTDHHEEKRLTRFLERSGLAFSTLRRPRYTEVELLVFGEEGELRAVGHNAIAELIARLVQQSFRRNCVHYVRDTEPRPELSETKVKGVYDYYEETPWTVECVKCLTTGRQNARGRCLMCNCALGGGYVAPFTDYFEDDGLLENKNVRVMVCPNCTYSVAAFEWGNIMSYK